MKQSKTRNLCLDSFKGIACLAVVFLHVRLPFEIIDGILQSAARFAIPLFFMVSGYYCYYEDTKTIVNRLPKKIVHILKIAGASFLYCLFIKIATCLFGLEGHSIISMLKSLIEPEAIIKFLLFNVDPLINILWFVFALLYVYVIVYIFAKINRINILIYLMPILLAVHFALGNIAYAFNIELEPHIFRNCWFMGLPLFMIGYLTKEKKLKQKINSNMARNLIFAGLATSVVEWVVIGGRQQMYIGSIIAAVAMIIYSEHNPSKVFSNCLYTIGNKYSLFVYIVHISVGIILDRMAKMANLIDNIVYLTTKPIIVIIGSIVFAITFYKTLNFIKDLRNNETAKS